MFGLASNPLYHHSKPLFNKLPIVFSVFLLPLIAAAHLGLTPGGFVNDYAGILTAEQKQMLEAKLTQFEKETGSEIAVAIIPGLQDSTIEKFAVELFEDWKIGQADKDNGVLLLVAIAERKLRIEVGYGLEGALTDAQSFWIIKNSITPRFKEGDYYQGINGGLDKIIAAAKGEYVPAEPTAGRIAGLYETLGFFVWVFFFLFIYIGSLLARSKSWWGGGVGGGILAALRGLIVGFVYAGLIALAVLVPLGLLFDFLVSRSYIRGVARGRVPWWIGGRGWGGGSGSSFGGFGGGS